MLDNQQQTSNGEGIGLKVKLAVFSFLLGLLATAITNYFSRARTEVAYSIDAEPIVSVRQSVALKPELETALKSLRDITNFRVKIKGQGLYR